MGLNDVCTVWFRERIIQKERIGKYLNVKA